MRFLRGLMVGILCFVIMMFSAFVVAGNFMEVDENLNFVMEDFSFEKAMQEVPLWAIIFLLSFSGMIIGPFYYWLIEPTLEEKPKPPRYEY